MQTEVIIVGQGICGTWLSWFLKKEGISFVVIDDGKENASSRAAAGIINPVTGRRLVRTWMIEELMPFAWKMHNEIGNELKINALSQKNIIEFFSAPDVKIAFDKRLSEEESFLINHHDEALNDFFHIDFGCGMIEPAYTAHLENLLPAWAKKLKENDQFLEEYFDISLLKVAEKKIIYKDIIAEKVIFCDGVTSAQSGFFSNLPFAINKGEALMVEINGLPENYIFKKGLSLVPTPEKNIFWLGSNYLWEFEDDQPTEQFRKEAEQKLKNWIKLPFKIIDHKAALRPANVERRPFVGFHPQYKNVGILNGMGTKGCSLAPFFAKQLVDHIVKRKALLPQADILRFQKILLRN